MRAMQPLFCRSPHCELSGLKIMPSLVLPFISTTSGAAKRKCRTQPCSSTAGCAASHAQSTKPSPASGLTVKQAGGPLIPDVGMSGSELSYDQPQRGRLQLIHGLPHIRNPRMCTAPGTVVPVATPIPWIIHHHINLGLSSRVRAAPTAHPACLWRDALRGPNRGTCGSLRIA